MSLAAPLSCTRCGFQNQPGYQFCSNCGAPLGAAAAAAPPAYPYSVPPGYTPYGPSVDYERNRQVDRTKTGALLLLIGTLLSWIPLIQFVGYLLIFIGVILVILGRKAFGPAHSRNVVVSIVLFIVGILVVIGVAVFAALSNLSGVIGPGGTVNVTPAFLASVANAGLLAGIVAAFILGIAELLFTYGLQAQTGRILLWAAYGANIALSVTLYLALSPLFNGVITAADYDSALLTQETYALLNVIPAMLFAGADYLAWSRINRREIPAPVLGPVGAPPMPPQTPPSGPAPPTGPR
jgi:MFS family permease